MPSATAEQIQSLDPNRHAATMGRLMLETAIEPSNATENLLQHAALGPNLLLPTNYLKEKNGIVVPSMELITPRGHEARFVDIHGSDPTLDKLYNQATGNGKKTDQVQRMVFEGIVRMLDTSGAEGLHHLHNTRFPNTVFHDTRRVNGLTPNIYFTKLGETNGTTGNVPVIGLVTATTGAANQLKLVKAIGGDANRQRFKK
jgi:hypothetical protein